MMRREEEEAIVGDYERRRGDEALEKCSTRADSRNLLPLPQWLRGSRGYSTPH